MREKDSLQMEWNLYKTLIGKELKIFPVPRKEPPMVNELRELFTYPPLYFALIEEVPFDQVRLFKALVLTEEVGLGWLGPQTPIIRLSHLRTLLVALPFWVYLGEDFLANYTQKLGTFNEKDLKRIVDYAERVKIPQDIRGKYISFLMEQIAPYNTEAILTYLEKLEEYQFVPSVFTISDDLKAYYEQSQYAYAKAASSKNVHKGKNFFAIVEKDPRVGAKLTLYLPQDFLGQKVTIKQEDKVLFEGTLETIKLEFVNLPQLSDYTSWLEAIDVELSF